MSAKPGGEKTFILELKNGSVRKITIPNTWKLTFGQLVPHTLRETHGATSQVALRIYEGSKENLRAVMTDVVAIRDASIEVSEKRTTVQRKHAQRATHQGAKDVVVEARVTEWINPDADDIDTEPNEFLKLTADT
jgi:hypothetical protein